MPLCRRRSSSSSSDEIEKQHDQRFLKSVKMLLLGTGESGKTTIIKQMKILHINGFSREEKLEKIPFIKQNIHESIYDIVDNMGRIHPAVNLKKEENNSSAEYILNLGPTVPADFTEVYFEHVKKLWLDEGVQEAFQRSNEYQLIDSAQHFLDRIDEIKKSDYIPSIEDILFCRIRTTSISEIEFSVPVPKIYGGGTANFLMYDVGGQRGERRKWIQVFDGIDAVFFIIAASDYDQTLREDENRNRLEEAITLFGEICKSKFLQQAGMIVFLNKQDIFEKKIRSKNNLGQYFPEFLNFKGQSSNYENAKAFLSEKLKDISKKEVIIKNFNPVTNSVVEKKLPPRDIYLHHTVAIDTTNVKKVFDSAHERIIKMSLGRIF